MARRLIERTSHAAPAAVEDMRVHHRGLDARMTQQLLDGTDVVARLQQMRRERVAQHVRSRGFTILARRTAFFIARWTNCSSR